MPRTLSSSAVVALNEPWSSDVWIQLVTLTHASLGAPIRMCDDPYELIQEDPLSYGLTSRGELFVYTAFRLTLPVSAPDQLPRATLEIDNVDRAIMADLRTLQSPMAVTLEVLRHADLETPEISIDSFELREVSYDPQRIRGALVMRSIARDPFPGGRFSKVDFPGLFG